LFFLNSTYLTNYTVIECAAQFLLSYVLNCTNMKTDFVDFGK